MADINAIAEQIQGLTLLEASQLVKMLEEKLGVPARVVKEGSRGKLVIQFYSEDEWQGILDKLIGPEEEI